MRFSIKKAVTIVAVCFTAGLYGTEPYFTCSFNAVSHELPEGWSSHGAGKTGKDVSVATFSLSELFPADGDAYRVLSFPGVKDAAYSNSTTVEGGKVEEWLISPLISIPEGKDALILRFDEIAVGSIRPGDYDVLLSEGGTETSDFITHLYSGRPKGTAAAAVAGDVSVPVNGFGGKNVRLAFVNRSSGTFLLGFAGISLIDYNVDVTSLIPEFTSSEGDINTAFDISVTTPKPCGGFGARLYVEGEDVREYSTDSDLSEHFSETITFTPALSLSFNQKKDYKLEIKPADGSLPVYMFQGSVTCAEGFPGVCVMEEATGTWCPACVRGSAAIAKYSDDYPGQFFGIAVHENDPMTVEAYNSALKAESKISSFPSGWFNRTVRDDPQKQSLVENFVSRRLPSKVTVDAVFHYEEDGVEKLTVLYSPQLCYDSSDTELRAVAVITEDHCKGYSSDWSQNNGYAGASVKDVGGNDWWPYFEFFSAKGSVVPAPEMEYNHVGWGIYNDYCGIGANIASIWRAYTPQQYSVTFAIPRQPEVNMAGVQELSNTAVTVILLDGKTGQVAGADRMEATSYIEGNPTGMATASASGFRAFRNTSGIVVETSCPATVEVFDISGTCLFRKNVSDSTCLPLTEVETSPLIIRITAGNHMEIFKLS